MANPQLENGYLQIANEVFEALCCSDLTGNEFRVMLAVMRKTWGWRKKADVVTRSELSEITGIKEKVSISEACSRLVARRMVIRTARPGKPSTYGPQKDWEEWVGCTKNGTSTVFGTSTENGTGVVPKTVRGSTENGTGRERKSRSPKYTIQKTCTKDKYTVGKPPVQRLTALFIDLYRDSQHENPATTGATIGGILKPLVRDFSEEEVERRMRFYFASTDDWIRSKAYSIQIFKTKFNELRDGAIGAKGQVGQSAKQQLETGYIVDSKGVRRDIKGRPVGFEPNWGPKQAATLEGGYGAGEPDDAGRDHPG